MESPTKEGATPGDGGLLDRLTARIAQLERMVEMGHLLNSTLDLPQLLHYIIVTATELLHTEAASILLVDERTEQLFFAAATGESQDGLRKIKVPLDSSIAGKIYQKGQPMIVGDVTTDPRHYSFVDQSISFQTRSLLGVPMEVRNRRIGVLEAINKLNGEPFNAEDIKVLSVMAEHATVAIENARLVARLQAANLRLSELDRMKSNFISIASHELRTPLMIVQGYASFLRDHATADTSSDLDMVLRGAQKLQAVIDQMTNLSFLESGSSTLERSPTILQDLINAVHADWESLAAMKKQVLRLKLPHQPISVSVDRKKIELVLNNLLDNAVKFTAEGGQIEIQVLPHTGKVAVAVVDTGIGIPKQYLSRVFDRFYQVEDHLTRQHGGLGLGLSIARAVVERHGGQIWAESVVGRGSRFVFLLPTELIEE